MLCRVSGARASALALSATSAADGTRVVSAARMLLVAGAAWGAHRDSEVGGVAWAGATFPFPLLSSGTAPRMDDTWVPAERGRAGELRGACGVVVWHGGAD